MRLTLLIPELLWSEPGDSEANAPAAGSVLAKILAQRHFSRQPNNGWEACLLRLSGLHADSSLAVLRGLGETPPLFTPPVENAEARRWLCADPVHLRFHQDRLILADGHELALTTDELAGIATRLDDAFAGRAKFSFSGAARGYLQLTAGVPSGVSAGQPLSRKIGCEVRPGDFGNDAVLRGIANEIQMLLHADPVNQARIATGRPTVNALWLWGVGDAPGANAPTIDAISGEHPLVSGIARTLGIPHTEASPFVPRQQHTLQLIETLNTPTHYQNSLGYAAAWQDLERGSLAPALGALGRWQWQQLDIVAPVVFGELHWQLTPLAAWTGRIGRRRWYDLLSALAESGLSGK